MKSKSKRVPSLPIKTVSDTSAQCTKVCVIDSPGIDLPLATEIVPRVLKDRGITDAFVMALLLECGCRIGEALSVRYPSFLTGRRVHIRSEKGSNDRIVVVTCLPSLNRAQVSTICVQLPFRNRWYYYRLCKQYGCYSQMLGNKNRAVTHYGRHLLVKELELEGMDVETIQGFMGHKSAKSTDWYRNHKPTEM